MNLALARGSGAAQWLAALETACIKLGMFAPEALVVALGVGAPEGTPERARERAHEGDPRTAFGLQGADWLRIGERIAWLGLPTAFVFEGGSAQADIGIHTVNVLEGFETAAPT
jgi:acetoin utilization deacetylase AcuC-like enzyme